MAKKGDMRLKAYYDFEGDYTVAVQEYKNFFRRWTTVSRVWAVWGRSEEEAVRVATRRMEERKSVRLGVLK